MDVYLTVPDPFVFAEKTRLFPKVAKNPQNTRFASCVPGWRCLGALAYGVWCPLASAIQIFLHFA